MPYSDRNIDKLGSVAFTPVKNDLVGNIKVLPPPYLHHFFVKTLSQTERYKKVRDRQLANPVESETLQSLVINELKTKKHGASEGLLWLVRSARPSSPPLLLSSPNHYV